MSDLIDRQAAIDALADYIHNVDKVMGTGHLTADDCKDAAASVFEELPSAEPKVEKDINVPANDLISRQEAIDEVMDLPNCANGYSDTYDKERIIEMLEDLPSAQPEIIRCKDCKHNPTKEWFGCPMSHLSAEQRPEDAWCWRGERDEL